MANKNLIVSIIKDITQKRSAPCKKTLQKIVFLIEEKGVDIGCDYGIHFFGPYSADLDYAVREMCDDGILKIEYTSMEHIISVVNESTDINSIDPSIDEVISEFAYDSASELELIATALYVYSKVNDIKKVKQGVIKIKGAKYSETRIDSAIDRLKKSGYIAA